VTASLATAEAVTVTVPETVAPEIGDVIETVNWLGEDGGFGLVGLLLLTVIDTPALVALLLDVSVANAVNVCLPLLNDVVVNGCEYGAEVTGEPKPVPSTMNCTLATPTLSVAFALTVIVPETVAPETGEVIATVGGVVSGVLGVDGLLGDDGVEGELGEEGLLDALTPVQPDVHSATTTKSHAACTKLRVENFRCLPEAMGVVLEFLV
jgi:hypothetical protein